MVGYSNGEWHNASAGGLAYRPPPTVDEAIPYSPFTSMIPFSPDIIPFPSAEPPTPPSTLTTDQQHAAKKAVGILNSEIQGQTTAQHLSDTLRQLRDLLHPDKLPEYHFKAMPQLATPPPDSPAKETNGAPPGHVPTLSPFAKMLLQSTDVSFDASDATSSSEAPRKAQTPARRPIPPPQARTPSQHPAATPNGTAHAQNAYLPYPSSALSSAPSSTPARPCPVVMPKPISVPRDEYKRYDDIDARDSLSQKKQADREAQAALRPHEREIADRKTEELRDLVSTLLEDKDDLDGTQHFETVNTPDGDCLVMKAKAMDNLSDKMSNIVNLGRFVALPVDLVTDVQSLLQPAITSTTKQTLFMQDDEAPQWSDSIDAAKFALKASKMVLDTMIEGRDDYRMRREEIIDVIVDLIKFVKDACIVPIVQARRTGPSERLFVAATGERKELQAVLRLSGRVISRFACLIGKCNLSDRAVNSMEFLTLELLMEQNSDSEKDSVFSIQKFEQFRQKAVDVLAQIFARHAEQRNSILNGILSNLEKLPDKKASARHYQLARGAGAIMPISALFMRFVQVAAANPDVSVAVDASDDESSDSDTEPTVRRKKKRNDSTSQIAEHLSTKSMQIAMHIVSSLVDRASNVSKTGDKPFRNLLDLFVEDFCNVFGSPEWPAAEMLLQQFLARMHNILQVEQTVKHSVVDKDMALSTITKIGCGVLDFIIRMKRLKREDLDVSQSDYSAKLARLFDEAVSDDTREGVNDMDLLSFDGPYRAVVESLRTYLELHTSDDPDLRSITGCHTTLWLAAVVRAFPDDDADAHPRAIQEVRERLVSMITDSKWLDRKYKFEAISEVQSRIAAGIITLQGKVCKYIPSIVTTLSIYMRDKNSSNLRSRGMAGVEQLVHKDPRVIREDNVRGMVEVLSDASPKVRESALNFVSTCLSLNPLLEKHFLPSILRLTNDTSNGPKKRAIKLLKDIYHVTPSKDSKLNIIASLLLPSQDHEKAIAELSSNVLEELLLNFTKSGGKKDENQLKFERAKRSALIIDTVQHINTHAGHLEAFEKFFVHALSVEAKAAATNSSVCKDLVADMIDEVISPGSGSDTTSQARTMTALSIFAKVQPSLFTVDQIQLLKLYIKEIGSSDDLPLLRSTVITFRHVIATLQSLQQSFAEEVRNSLVLNVSKLANWARAGSTASQETLVDVAHCLWTVTPMAPDGPLKLCTMIASMMCQLQPMVSCAKDTVEQQQKKSRIISYLILLGTFGKVCNLDQYMDVFRERLAVQAQNFVSKKQATAQQLESLLAPKSAPSLILLQAVRPFTMQAWDVNIRAHALQSLGGICQQSPNHFMRAEIEKVFQLVFINEDVERLKQIALDTFSEYFTFAERRSDTGAVIAVGQGAETGNARLETSFVASENDTAPLHLAQKFLANFVKIALENKNDLANSATQVITSISRQGLIHPKECGAPLVALGTCPDQRIAQPAAMEHKRIHEKQESYLEKEYMQSVRIAFTYQSEVWEDSHGMREVNFSPKLIRLFEALKAGKKATFKKFINNMCKHVDFSLSKLDVNGEMPDPVLFARFCLENLALLDFPHLEELAVCLNAVEAIVLKTTGPIVALAIETEMPKHFVAAEAPLAPDMLQQQLSGSVEADVSFASFMDSVPTTSQLAQPKINDNRLRQITVACMILLMVWETRTFIRRCYSMNKLVGRIPQKEFAKPAQRNNFVSGKDLWERLTPIMSALDSRESMVKTCYDFAELLEVDREAQISEDGDENGAGYETPTEGVDDSAVTFPTSGRGRKRKSNVSLGNTPKKPRGRPAKNKKRNSRTPDGDDDSD